jgi:hypothetical protein
VIGEDVQLLTAKRTECSAKITAACFEVPAPAITVGRSARFHRLASTTLAHSSDLQAASETSVSRSLAAR